ncbi:MAG: type VI secretion system tip protein TssI/VgrG, partial [Nitrospirota bacterium]|nr:type VI secretion system tip protein TssI/VgrG [Nitrospirota bacterium]
APTEGYAEVPYFPPDETAIRERDHISNWTMCQQIQSGTFAHNDFDFEAPNKNLQTKSIVTREHAQSTYENYNYPGEYTESADGENYARIRIQELQSGFETFQGSGDVQGLAVGSLFNLTDLPRDDQNKEYLVVAANHQLHSDAFDTDGESGPPMFSCSFSAIDAETPFRAARSTKKPMIQGPQTAVVCGPAGEEIWTDKYGRVMVQFHWDRYGQSDENSSCWIRVSQLWAGGQWGAIYTPRIGQEVIVEFLEGDPDRPVITGRVYNGSKMPPYALPAEKTKSTIKSNSSKGGGGSNELRFEDKAGSEEVYLHGQKDWTIGIENDKNQTVGHDETLDVGNNRTKTVGVDQSETIGSNKTISVGTDHTENIGANKVLSVGAEHTESVGANMSLTIGADRTLSIAANESISVGASKTEIVAIASAETIGAAKALSIGAAYQISVGAAMNTTVGGAVAEEIGGLKSVNVGGISSENIGGNKSLNAGGNISEKAGKDVSVSAAGNISESAEKDMSLSSGEKMSLSAGDDFALSGQKNGVIDIKDELTIKCGSASITLKKNGDILINGAKIQIKGSGDVIIKGSKILQN